ncbi:hypothetical protein [Sorangium sp. So ce388]|uniref:hypothetical protein n=1 Tax=Sorangium sp. So ce388 TaxID=3133309 RepID=UPI003F5C6EBB
MVTSLAHDFKGNLLQASRRLRSDVHADADWSLLAALTDVAAIAAAAEPLLETESFATQTAYDALDRPTSVTAPDTSELKPTYNEAGLLERVEARVRGAAAWTTFVDDIDYDAKGGASSASASGRRSWLVSPLGRRRVTCTAIGCAVAAREALGSSAPLPRKRQTLHHLHRVAPEDREVRVILEQPCRRLRAGLWHGSGDLRPWNGPARASSGERKAAHRGEPFASLRQISTMKISSTNGSHRLVSI